MAASSAGAALAAEGAHEERLVGAERARERRVHGRRHLFRIEERTRGGGIERVRARGAEALLVIAGELLAQVRAEPLLLVREERAERHQVGALGGDAGRREARVVIDAGVL